ncbi:hypothetical protein TSMEX_002766 [Taenia solium]|eukprot:TsM_000987500 transcript=TsM_000987500 gene=TsM_000987500
MDGRSDLAKSTFTHTQDEIRDSLNLEFPSSDHLEFDEWIFGIDFSCCTKFSLFNKWNSLDCCNSNDNFDCYRKPAQSTVETAISFSPKPNKDVIAEISIGLNCEKPGGYQPSVDDVCAKCIEVSPDEPSHFEINPCVSPLTKVSDLLCCPAVEQDCCRSLDEDSIRKTVTMLKENVDEINRALCSQISATSIEKQLLEEIQGMKLQLCELSEILKNQSSVCPPEDPCAQSSCMQKDSTLQLSRDIEEIRCCLQQLTAGLGCSSPPPSCPKCGSPCESVKAEDNDECGCKPEDASRVVKCQVAVRISQCDDTTQEIKTPSANINQFLLDKVEGLKTSIDDAIATDNVCSENEKTNELCAQSVTEKDDFANTCTPSVASFGNPKTSIERIFQILQDLEHILSSDDSNLNQDRALQLVCELKQLLESEFSNPSLKPDDDWAFRELSEKYNCAPPYPIPAPPCMTDERRHPDPPSHKGSAASLCGSGICNLAEFPPGKDSNQTIDKKVKDLLRELYCELQSFDEGVKAKVLSMLEEISETLEALQSCQQSEIAESINHCTDCKVQAEPEQFDACGLPLTPQEEMACENRAGCQTTIVPTPNLCGLVTELQSLINLLESSAQFPDYDFEANLDCTLNNLKHILQTKCNDSDILESIGSILKSMKAELCQQGAEASTQMAIIFEVEELLVAAGVNSSKGRQNSCESEHSTCYTDGTVPNKMYDEKIMTILGSIEGCIREAGSCCLSHAEAMLSTKNDQSMNVACSNAPTQSCLEEADYRSPAVVCAEAINSRVALILAELKGVVQTLEVEGSTLLDSTISRIFYIFDQIECILATDQLNARILMEIKQILGRIYGKGMGTVSECIVANYAAPTKGCSPPPTTDGEICESNSRNQLSTRQSEGCAASDRSSSSTLCPVYPTTVSETCKCNSRNRGRSSTMQSEGCTASERPSASTVCPVHPAAGSEVGKCNSRSQSRSRSSTIKSEGYLNRCLNALRKAR